MKPKEEVQGDCLNFSKTMKIALGWGQNSRKEHCL